LKALIYDSFYDEHKGVVIAVRLFDGKVTKRIERLFLIRRKSHFSPTEIGIFTPEMQEINELSAGEVGYIATGLKYNHLLQLEIRIIIEEIEPSGI
jgi:GTP-binding protein LepA